MTREEYMQEIKRTWQTGDLTQREEMCNAALGLVGETREYLRAFDASELGDCLFYAHTLLRLLEAEQKLDGQEPLTMVARDRLQDHAAEIAEDIKKVCFHGRSRETPRVITRVISFIRTLEARADYHDGADEVRAQNIAKLRRRYPRGFEEGGGVR